MYDHQAIEKKWQQRWAEAGVFDAHSPGPSPEFGRGVSEGRGEGRNSTYVLDMFPYPSGDGLHVGHPEGYTATDIYSRYLRMKGVNVLHPMGWDAFGLPAENFAIKKGIHPAEVTANNISNFKRQIQSLGFSYDWSREINTTDPKYYKWTQWIFLQLFKRGLAYEKEAPIWWCPKDKTGLANEEVVNGCCERCGTPVERKMLKQWMLKITAYADRLLAGLDKLNWPESIKALQRNWIGKSEGAQIRFSLRGITNQDDDKHFVEVFTTRPDTIFGATFLVISPELAQTWLNVGWKAPAKVKKYIDQALKETDVSRQDTKKEKTGADTGIRAVNPATNQEIPVWVADYVLGGYGTGAIMAVPAHDERDYAFAKKFKLLIRRVIDAKFVVTGDREDAVRPEQPFIKRQAVCAIVRNPKTDKYLCIAWKQHNMHGLVTGGIEDGEDPVEAAKREIQEETGYKNLRVVEGPDIGVQTFFYHRVKKQNRWAQFRYVFFELENDKRETTDAQEEALHEVVWKSADELQNFFTVFEGSFIIDVIKNPDFVYTGEGILRNSGDFTDLDSGEARKKIVAWLEQQGKAQPKVQYKLRDWVFSRQRYWGEPIPLVHCENCKKTVESTPHYLNFPDEKIWNNLINGKKTIEIRALNPEEPERYFGNIGADHTKSDAYFKGIFLPTGATAYFRVKSVKRYANIKELFADKETMAAAMPAKEFKSVKELEAAYEKMSPGYVEKMNNNGLIAFEVKHVLPGIIIAKDDELPILLPDVKKYEPTGTGESPLAAIDDWVNVTCRICGHPAKRETNTMPQWAGSCWYYLRFCDPHNDQQFGSAEALKAWLPVDLYVGGAEHAVLHLLYSRFWHLVLYDIGAIPKTNDQGESLEEPFMRLKNQGLILGPDGEKMSKSRGNVINPDDIVEQYGADTLRMYEMFMGPFEDAKPWDTNGIIGVRRFLERVWSMQKKVDRDQVGRTSMSHRYASTVSNGIERFQFNTCVSDLMKWSNEWKTAPSIPIEDYEVFVKLLSPFAPHLAEEVWQETGHETLLASETWPSVDEAQLQQETVTMAIQVNGKHRGNVTVPTGSNEPVVREAAEAEPNVKKYLTGEPKKVIFVKDKLLSFVV